MIFGESQILMSTAISSGNRSDTEEAFLLWTLGSGQTPLMRSIYPVISRY
jgi:hypothetical protein